MKEALNNPDVSKFVKMSLTLTLCLAFLAMVYAILFTDVANGDLAHLVVGQTIAMIGIIIGYHWGKGEKDKLDKPSIND